MASAQTLVIPMHNDPFTNVATTGAARVLHAHILIAQPEAISCTNCGTVFTHIGEWQFETTMEHYPFDAMLSTVCSDKEGCAHRETTREILAGLSDYDDYEDAVSDGYSRWMSGEF
jgi:hypothetical protein